MLISPYLCLHWGGFPPAPVVPEEAVSFSFEDTGSIPTGQTVGTEVISFPAVGVFPKLSIGKFQIAGIFMSCALDQIFMHPEGFSSPLCLQFPHPDLQAGEVHIIISFSSQIVLCSTPAALEFISYSPLLI